MAVGVTEQEVFGAADAVLARGERPTYERVRAELGRGSPARVGQLLEIWWTTLAQRLAKQLAMPAAPAAISEAFVHVWEAALEAARAHAETVVAPERAALADVVAKAESAVAAEQAVRRALEAQLATAQAEANGHYAALVMSDQRNGDLQHQVAALQADQQAYSLRLDATLARHHAVVLQADTDRAAAATEREALQAHVRQVEDRAHAEVDRARESLKAASQEARRAEQAAAAERATLTKARNAALAAQHTAERRAGASEAALAAFRKATSLPRPKPQSARARVASPLPSKRPRPSGRAL